tara:strand:- start:299 stop:412 length:114 start_codon:yes stop_codon:yes gene_type:complete
VGVFLPFTGVRYSIRLYDGDINGDNRGGALLNINAIA